MTRIIEEGEVRIQGAEATDGILGLYSDQGDDDADKWRITKYASTENLNFEYWDGTTWQTAFALVREGNVNQTLLFPSLYIRQLISAPTFTKPVLQLEQTDLSEEFIEFDATVAAGNPIQTAAVGTYYGKIRVSVNGTFKYIALYNT